MEQDAEQAWEVTEENLRRNRMAVLPGTYASKSRFPYRPKRRAILAAITENREDGFEFTSDKEAILPIPDIYERSGRKLSQSNSLSGFMLSGAEFVRSWSHYSLPNIELMGSMISLPEMQSVDRRSTSLLFGINLQSMVLGTSVLSLPFAFYKGGIYAIVLTVIIGFLTCYTGSILVECLYQSSTTIPGVRKRVRGAYIDICVSIWPKYGKYVMETLVYISLARNTVVFVLLTDLLMETLKDSMTLSSDVDQRVWTCAWAVAVMPLLFIKRVSALAWVSFIGLVLYLLALLATLVSVAVMENTWDFKHLNLDFDFTGVGLATGIIINSFSQHLSFPALEGSMQNPANYKMSLQTTFMLNIVMKVGFGMVGVLNFGPLTAQTITGNLPDQPYIAIPIRVAIMFFTYFTVPMQSFVIFDLIDRKFTSSFPLLQARDGTGNWMWVFLSRSTLVTLCLLFAVLIPDFGVILGLIGSIRGALVALVFPALFHYLLFQKTTRWYVNAFNIFVVFLGCLFAILGLYGSIREMFKI